MFQGAEWRTTRHPKVTFLGVGATGFEDELAGCTYNAIAALIPSYADVLARFLVYNDLLTCTATGGGGSTIPTVCTSKMTAADSSDDVVNSVTLEYQAPQTPVGFVQGTNTKVNATAPQTYIATDAPSQQRYGVRSLTRGDLTPNTPASVLPALASKWVARWKDGDATITTVEIDFAANAMGGDNAAARIVAPMFSGDLVNVVDLVPGQPNTAGDWMVSTAEVASMGWNLNPERFTVTLMLDEVAVAT